MNTRCSHQYLIRTFARCALLGLALTTGVAADEPAPSQPRPRLFVASDLPMMAEGIPIRAGGDYTLKVWAPAQQVWEMSGSGDTLTLTSHISGDDATPRWQGLGTTARRAGDTLRIVVQGLVTSPPPRLTVLPRLKKGQPPVTPPKPPAVPTLILLSPTPGLDPEPALDLARGRIDTAIAPPDQRRGRVRTNQEGAGFTPPATADAWCAGPTKSAARS